MAKVSAAKVVALAACGLLAVALVSEVAAEQGETVLMEEGAAAASTARWAQRTELAAQPGEDVAPIDNSQDVAAQALSRTQAENHESNHEARHAIRKELASGATEVVQGQIKTLTDQAQKMAKIAAAKTAAQIADKAASELPPHTKGVDVAEKKLKLLEEDKKLLEDALQKEKENAKQEDQHLEEKAEKYRTEVSKKVTQAKEDFAALKDKLHSYEGTNTKEHDTRQQLHQLMEDIDRDRDKLKGAQDRLGRMKDRQKNIVSTSEEEMAHERDKLKDTLAEYKTSLKGLKEKLRDVKNATDINEEIATRITSAQEVIKKQDDKISQLSTDLSTLKKELERTTLNNKALTEAAKEKKHALHLAQSAVEKLSETAAKLKDQAEQPVPEVHVEATQGSDSATSTKKAVGKIVDAVKSETDVAKETVQAKAVEEAKTAAKEAAAKLVPKPEIQVPGADTALEEAEKTLGDLGVGHSDDSDGGASDQGSTEVLLEPMAAGMDQALQKAGQTLTELHLKAKQDESLHKAELVAHVAHTLFVRAQKSGSAVDKAAAKVAMKRAIAAHAAVGHVPSPSHDIKA